MIEMCLLGGVVDVSAGQPAPSTSEFANSGEPFIRAGSLENLLNGGSLSDCEKISKATAIKRGLRLYPKDTIVFAKSGMSATLGRIYRLEQPAYVVSHLAALVPTGKYDPAFLTHWLRSNPPSHLIRDAAYPSIRISEIEELRVPDASLPEQQRISAILDKAYNIVRKRQQALAMADDFLRSVFLDSFGDPRVNPHGFDEEPFSSILTTPLRNGISPSSKGEVDARVLTLGAITGNRFDGLQLKYGKFLEPISRTDEVDESDFYICRGSGTPELVGRGFFAESSMPGVAFPDTMIAAKPDPEKVTRGYLQAIWNSPFIRSQIVNSARTTNGTYKINQTAAGAITLPLPPLSEQLRFDKVVAKVRSLQRKLAEKSDLFESVSQRAFLGQL